MERGPLQDPSLKELSEKFVALRMTGGTKDASPGIDAFMTRYGIEGFPTLLVLSPEGGLLKSEFGRDPESLLRATREGQKAEDDFQTFKKAVQATENPALWLGLAQFHLIRKEYTAAIPILQKVAEKEPTPYRLRQLADTQGMAADHAGAVKTYDALLKIEPSPANHVARARAQSATGDADGAIDYLRGLAEKAEKPADKKTLLDGAAEVLWQQVADQANGGKWKAAATLMDRLFKEYPASSAAQNAKRWEEYIREQVKAAEAETPAGGK